MEKRRQRDVCALLAAAAVLGALTLPACSASAPLPDSASTAIAVAPTLAAQAQTSANAAQTAIAAAQTVLPGAQATVQAGATAAAGVLGDPRLVSQALSLLLAGANVTLQIAPPDATGEAAQQVAIDAVDTSGAFGRLDSATQHQAANGALMAAAQAFPKATLALTVKDGAGSRLVSGTKTPESDPSISQ